MSSTYAKKFLLPVGLLTLLVLGTLLRVHNLSIQKIYPDSYQSLLTALFIQHYHSVVGYLGEGGMIYPDFFAWTRPGFPLFILLANLFTHNISTAASLVSLLAAISSLPIAFMLGKRFFSSNRAGLISMLLLCVSFNHIVWGGFILTEALSVCLMLLMLLLLLHGERIKHHSFFLDAVIGLISALLLLTRYEYALLLLPLGLFIHSSKNYLVENKLAILVSFSVPLITVFYMLFPARQAVVLFLVQAQDLWSKALIALIAFGVVVMVYQCLKLSTAAQFHRSGGVLLMYGIWSIYAYLFLQYFFPILSFGYIYLSSLRNFVTDDMLLSLFCVIGMTCVLQEQGEKRYFWLSSGAVGLLYAVYLHTNPEMERYLTHLIPFMLLPATYGVYKIIDYIIHKKPQWYLLCVGLILCVGVQITFSCLGIRNWGDRTWFQTSYDEQVAIDTKKYFTSPDEILLVSFPEPYFFVTRQTTYSLADSYPYIYLPPDLLNRPVVISEDMGMLDIFPHFSKFLDQNMQDRKVNQFFVKKPYHFSSYSKNESSPVILYRTTGKELIERIKKSK